MRFSRLVLNFELHFETETPALKMMQMRLVAIWPKWFRAKIPFFALQITVFHVVLLALLHWLDANFGLLFFTVVLLTVVINVFKAETTLLFPYADWLIVTQFDDYPICPSVCLLRVLCM